MHGTSRKCILRVADSCKNKLIKPSKHHILHLFSYVVGNILKIQLFCFHSPVVSGLQLELIAMADLFQGFWSSLFGDQCDSP